VLIAFWCFFVLILRCLMHVVKPNVIKLFNRLSLLANQNTSTSMQQSMSMVSPVVMQTNHCNTINNQNASERHENGVEKLIDSECHNGDCLVASNNCNSLAAAAKSSQHQKFVMSSSFQLHEDDLSKIDVKSLVSSRHSARICRGFFIIIIA
jgi:hypothetical protein